MRQTSNRRSHQQPPPPSTPPPSSSSVSHPLNIRRDKRVNHHHNSNNVCICRDPLVIIAVALLCMVMIIGVVAMVVLSSESSALHRLACAHEHYVHQDGHNPRRIDGKSNVTVVRGGDGGGTSVISSAVKLVDQDKRRVKLRKQYDDYVTSVQRLFNKYSNVVHIITHTHWDREWYLPFERFRRKFVWVVDQVLHRFHTRPNEMHHFHMDGQVVPYMDYMEIKPERHQEIVDLINSGKMSIGPWYTAPDEFLASAEALARNLLNGYRHTRRLGVEWMKLGYGADNFGHISQLPQLYALFGIETVVQARGVPANMNMEFMWRGADDTELLVIYMKHWYCHAEGSPRAGGGTFAWFNKRIQQSERSSATKHLLLMNGCDHTPMDANILDNIKMLQKPQQVSRLGRKYVFQSDFNIYSQNVKEQLKANGKANSLRRVVGEQRVGIASLSHIASNKITQKQANWRCQSLLEHYAEPLRTLAWVKGWLSTYEMGFMWYAWENILKSHAHDSIGGCSVPEVHKDVDHRFRICQQVAETQVDEALQVLMKHTNLKSGSGESVLVVNTMASERNDEPVVVRIDGKHGQSVKVVDVATGKEVEAEVLETHSRVWDYTLPENGFRRPWIGGRTFIGILASVKATGTHVYSVQMSPSKQSLKDVPLMENQYLKITVQNSGEVSIEDKISKTTHDGMNVLEIEPDRGDEYNSQASGRGLKLEGGKVSQVQQGPLGYRCHVTGTLAAPNGKKMPVHIHYYLGSRSRHLSIRVTVRNRNNGFRMRAASSTTTCGVTSALVDSHFDVLSRQSGARNLAEAQQDFVSFKCRKSLSLTFANRGLPEYQYLNGKYYLTLLRATGRMGDWGTFPSGPSSQEHGYHSFEYAIILTKTTLEGQAIARHFNVRMVGVRVADYPGVIQSRPLFDISHSILYFLEKHKKRPEVSINTYHNPADHSPRQGGRVPGVARSYTREDALPFDGQYMSLEPNDKVVLSAMKLSERRGPTLVYGPYEDKGTEHEDRGRGVIIRWYNPTSSSVKAQLRVRWPIRSAHLCDMREERVSVLKNGANSNNEFMVEVSTPPKKIITVELEPTRDRVD